MPACMFISQMAPFVNEKMCSSMETSINKANKLQISKTNRSGLFTAVSAVPHCRLGKSRLYTDEKVTACFTGTLIDQDAIPWEGILFALEKEKYDIFSTFNAPFVVMAHFHDQKKTFLISDMCSQLPVYYSTQNGNLLASTSLSTFFDCLDLITFNEKWLTDFVLFNFPIAETTPITEVKRVSSATVLSWQDGSINFCNYAPVYRSHIPVCSDKEMKERTYEIFKERFPKYYGNLEAGPYAASITGGFDSRLCVLFAPETTDLHLYTYGTPQCHDMTMGKMIAQTLGYPHHALGFTDEVITSLADMADQCIDYTGGSLNILRSTLVWLYEQLSTLGLESVVTGIVGDHFFRSGGSPGSNLSIAASELFQNPQYEPQNNPYFSVFLDKKKAMDHFIESRDSLEKRFNWSSLPMGERHLTYAMYELSIKYFGGEAELANHYIDISSPFWDNEIRKNAYNNTISTHTLTKYMYDVYPHWKKHSIFASMLERHPKFKNIPINGLPPKYYAAGNRNYFLLGKILVKGKNKIYRMIFPQPEDYQEKWHIWLGKYLLAPLVQSSSPLLISEYFAPAEIQKIINSETGAKATGANHFIGGKLVTAELVLRKFQEKNR